MCSSIALPLGGEAETGKSPADLFPAARAQMFFCAWAGKGEGAFA